MGFKWWAAAAKRWRGDLRRLHLALPERRRFWERFTALALAAPDRRPTAEDRETLLAQVRDDDPGGRRLAMSRWSAPDRAIRSC